MAAPAASQHRLLGLRRRGRGTGRGIRPVARQRRHGGRAHGRPVAVGRDGVRRRRLRVGRAPVAAHAGRARDLLGPRAVAAAHGAGRAADLSAAAGAGVGVVGLRLRRRVLDVAGLLRLVPRARRGRHGPREPGATAAALSQHAVRRAAARRNPRRRHARLRAGGHRHRVRRQENARSRSPNCPASSASPVACPRHSPSRLPSSPPPAPRSSRRMAPPPCSTPPAKASRRCANRSPSNCHGRSIRPTC